MPQRWLIATLLLLLAGVLLGWLSLPGTGIVSGAVIARPDAHDVHHEPEHDAHHEPEHDAHHEPEHAEHHEPAPEAHSEPSHAEHAPVVELDELPLPERDLIVVLGEPQLPQLSSARSVPAIPTGLPWPDDEVGRAMAELVDAERESLAVSGRAWAEAQAAGLSMADTMVRVDTARAEHTRRAQASAQTLRTAAATEANPDAPYDAWHELALLTIHMRDAFEADTDGVELGAAIERASAMLERAPDDVSGPYARAMLLAAFAHPDGDSYDPVAAVEQAVAIAGGASDDHVRAQAFTVLSGLPADTPVSSEQLDTLMGAHPKLPNRFIFEAALQNNAGEIAADETEAARETALEACSVSLGEELARAVCEGLLNEVEQRMTRLVVRGLAGAGSWRVEMAALAQGCGDASPLDVPEATGKLEWADGHWSSAGWSVQGSPLIACFDADLDGVSAPAEPIGLTIRLRNP